MNRILFVLSIVMIVVGCGTTNNLESNTVEFDVISKGILGGAGAEGIEKQNLVITDTESWKALISKIDSGNTISPSFSEINIDFSNYTVIAVFDNVKNSGGFGLDLEVKSDLKNTIIQIVKTAPGPTDFVTMMITQPYCIIKIPNTSLPVVFE